MKTLNELRTQIVPIPKKVEAAAGQPLVLTADAKFSLSIPEADFGPLKGAKEKLCAFLETNCGTDCYAPDGIAITAAIGEVAEEACSEGGYLLEVNADGVTVTGYDERGVLYGVITLTQLLKWDHRGVSVPALRVLDWPESKLRGIKEECRYGSNVMEREEWMAMLDDMVSKKMNFLMLALYGCWKVQYDGRVSEYLYMPVKGHPELRTPMMVKYFSPTQNRWIACDKLPPIFCDNLLEDIFSRCRDLGIKLMPSWNSFGHNTLLPAMIPEVSAKEEDGVTPTKTGFCVSNPATYDLLFSIYDQIIDDYMKPYGMDMFNILLDEVHDEPGQNAEDPQRVRSPWCKCPECSKLDRAEMFLDHAVKCISYLKSRGVKTVQMACDMLLPNRRKSLGWLGDRLMEKIKAADLTETVLVGWWTYFDLVEKMYFDNIHPELGLRGICCPWSGYYNWCLLTNPLRNVKLLAEMNHRDGGEGMYAYAMWDRSYDRIHDAVADYSWDYEMTGTEEDVTDRYVARHFGNRFDEARHAYRLVDWITEERKENFEDDLTACVSNFNLLLYKLSYYTYSYVTEKGPYPQNFPGGALRGLLKYRRNYERAMYSIRSMAREAAAIFRDLATDPGCDRPMADRMAAECENYLCMVEDWLTLLTIYDLTQGGDQKKIAPLARARQNAHLALMAHYEQVKETFANEALLLRNQSIFMQMFSDFADYIENTEEPQLDLMNVKDIMSDRFFWLR